MAHQPIQSTNPFDALRGIINDSIIKHQQDIIQNIYIKKLLKTEPRLDEVDARNILRGIVDIHVGADVDEDRATADIRKEYEKKKQKCRDVHGALLLSLPKTKPLKEGSIIGAPDIECFPYFLLDFSREYPGMPSPDKVDDISMLSMDKLTWNDHTTPHHFQVHSVSEKGELKTILNNFVKCLSLSSNNISQRVVILLLGHGERSYHDETDGAIMTEDDDFVDWMTNSEYINHIDSLIVDTFGSEPSNVQFELIFAHCYGHLHQHSGSQQLSSMSVTNKNSPRTKYLPAGREHPSANVHLHLRAFCRGLSNQKVIFENLTVHFTTQVTEDEMVEAEDAEVAKITKILGDVEVGTVLMKRTE